VQGGVVVGWWWGFCVVPWWMASWWGSYAMGWGGGTCVLCQGGEVFMQWVGVMVGLV